MTQKIVITVSMNCDKCRSKAMKIAVSVPGVQSVAITGEERNQVEVVGIGVDSVVLTRRLRKKVAHAQLVSVGEVKEKEKEKPVVVAPAPFYGAPPICYYEEKEPNCSIM